MNRKTIAVLSIAAACVLSAGTAAAFSSLHEQQEQSRAVQPEDDEPAYWLKEYNGRLAVFERGGVDPVRIIDLDVRTLPPYDRGCFRRASPPGTGRNSAVCWRITPLDPRAFSIFR